MSAAALQETIILHIEDEPLSDVLLEFCERSVSAFKQKRSKDKMHWQPVEAPK